MKKFHIISVWLILTLHLSWAQERPKVGLVLSGGGAKGFAHVGVLKVLEEVGIPIDYVGGTSIGGIIGGLYAVGYDADALEEIITNLDWAQTLSDKVDRGHIPFFEKSEMDRYQLSLPVKRWKLEVPNSIIKGQNITNTFTQLTYGYHDITDFSKLNIPFLCVAADLETGKEMVLDNGFLPFCMKATMAIPGVFRPQEIDGAMLIDGGVINNFPVDQVQKMSDEKMIIIGVDLSSGLKDKDDLGSIGNVMSQLITVMGLAKYEKNKAQCDIYINPDLTGYGASSFSKEAAEVLTARGENAARSIMGQLIELRERLGIQVPNRKSIPFPNTDSLMFLREVVFDSDVEGGKEYLAGKIDLKAGSYVSLDDIERGIANIYGTQNYELVNYKVTGDKQKTLFIYLNESSRNSFNLGAHYDDVNKAGLLINTTLRKGHGSGARLSANLKLATQLGADVGYTIDRGIKPGLNSGVEFRSVRFSILDGDITNNVVVDFFKAKAGTHTVFDDVFTFGLQLAYQTSRVNTIFTNDTTGHVIDFNAETGFEYSAFLKYDNLDNIFYPTTGSRLDAGFKVFTNNFFQYKHGLPVMTFNLKYNHAFMLSPKLVLMPSVYVRGLIFNNNKTGEAGEVPYMFRTYVGGNKQNDYFDSQVPFFGMPFMSMDTYHASSAMLRVNYQLFPKHYFGFAGNFAVHSKHKSPLDGLETIYGGALTYSHNSFLGPIDLYLSASSYHSGPITYLSVGYWF